MKPLDTNKDPQVLGPFEMLARLGEGGMGVAYLARRIPLDGFTDEDAAAYQLVEADAGMDAAEPRLVVVKMIKPELLDGEPQARERFAREIDAVGAVVSERVPALIAWAPDAEWPWFAMDYVAGPSLHTMVTGSGPLGVGPYAALGLALVDALRVIHGAGLLHRDLKPSNVVLGPDGPVVLDFGLAVLAERQSSQALTASNVGIGTLDYMPLEQRTDAKHVKEPADVYALGATLFFALTGRPPYPHGPLTTGPTNWDGVDSAFIGLLAQILVPYPVQRPKLDAVEANVKALLAASDLTPELAAEQLATLVAESGLTPKLPAAALADQASPAVQELAQKAVDAGAAPDAPWADGGAADDSPGFYGLVDTEEIELAQEAAVAPPQDPTPTPADERPAEPPAAPSAPLPAPAEPTSYRLQLPEPPEPEAPPPAPVPQGAPKAALRVAERLREAYAHRGDL
ncbi:serine/threonine-protein kinase [Streptomyces spongiae]|uniref:Serine/threonine protein kinase n=1 Tax=Streptomyces spongiae TaxID=565072 RepID=A0A5N8XJD8_9ACTN|nr:serine/threonine-protein kinase [Streptomyces spongiae]MPY59581.1 serine/threonine protein kinase [Streptomyces spongiae]